MNILHTRIWDGLVIGFLCAGLFSVPLGARAHEFQRPERLNPKVFSGAYTVLDSVGGELSEIAVSLIESTQTLSIVITGARNVKRIGTEFLPPLENINREPKISQRRVAGGCILREQVSSTDATRVFSQIGETYKALCLVRTKYTKLEYSVQLGNTAGEIVLLWGAEAGAPANRLTLRKIELH